MSVTTLPGTTIETSLVQTGAASAILTPMFMAGGLVLSQVSSLTGLPPHMLQNWVKRGFVSPPVRKKYSKSQFCRIVIINFLKDSLLIDRITRLIGAINGNLADDSDDTIDDSLLYTYFVDVIALSGLEPSKIDSCIDSVLSAYEEPFAGIKRRVADVLKVMVKLYDAMRLREEAELILCGNLNIE